eukprot:g5172.t1
MLLYDNKGFFWLLLNRRGSVFYRWDSLLGGLCVALLGGAVQYMHTLGVAVTFAIVFRTQLAWNRYWEAVTQLHVMYSKWHDAFSQFQGFAEVTLKAAKEKKDEAKIKLIMMKQRTWEMPLLGFQVDQSFVNSLGRFCPLQFVVSTDQGC